jgi:hypothetical protein
LILVLRAITARKYKHRALQTGLAPFLQQCQAILFIRKRQVKKDPIQISPQGLVIGFLRVQGYVNGESFFFEPPFERHEQGFVILDDE